MRDACRAASGTGPEESGGRVRAGSQPSQWQDLRPGGGAPGLDGLRPGL